MALVITEPCLGCKDQSCVVVCPVDAIHPGIVERHGKQYDQFFINADECICCRLCQPECPVNAIYDEDEVPDHWSHFTAINAAFFEQPKS